MPPELVDLIQACRVLAARPIAVDGSAVDERGEVAPGSGGAKTMAEAGRRLGIGRRQVCNLLHQKKLDGRQVGRRGA